VFLDFSDFDLSSRTPLRLPYALTGLLGIPVPKGL